MFKELLQLLLFQCMIAYTYMYSESGLSQQVGHFPQGSATHNQNHSVCPMWFNYSSATNNCQCFPFFALKCEGKYAFVDDGELLTYNSHKGLISAIRLRHRYLGGYNITMAGFLSLPNNISELNEYMCGPLNRKDYLCSQCRSGYGPTVFLTSCTHVCYFCHDTWYDIILYLSLQFVPVTVFYFLILVFQIKLTSAPMTCFILYSQLIVLAFYKECSGISTPTLFSTVKYMTTGDLRLGTKILLTVYGIFNLDFFHYVISPFCISSQLKPIHIVFLGYISVFYPFLLIILTWLCVELHGRNFRPIVCLWRPFHRCFVRLRRGWNTKSDLVDVFASFFLLSYSKFVYQLVLTVNCSLINNYSLMKGLVSEEYVLGADPSINTKSINYIILMMTAAILSFTFIFMPVPILLFYPTAIFQRLLSKCTLNRFRIILNIFVEKFQCCYKDGLDGVSGRRSFSVLYFLLRIIVCIIEVINRSTFKFETWFARGFTFLVTALLISSSRPYKKTYMNIVDSILLSHLATLCYVASSNHKSRVYLQFLQIAIFFPFAVFCVFVAFRMAYGICKVHFQWLSLQCLKASQVRAFDISTSHNRQQIAQPKATYGTINLC